MLFLIEWIRTNRIVQLHSHILLYRYTHIHKKNVFERFSHFFSFILFFLNAFECTKSSGINS
jgi:hypothetical protein